MMHLTTLCLFLFSFVSLTSASPLIQRIVWNPPITEPNSKTVWIAGSKQTITWDVTNIPPVSQLTRPTGKAVLGYDTGDSLNLQIDNPLADGFNLTDGKVDITVPTTLSTRKDYIVVVFGDSGNASPKFTINGLSRTLVASSTSSSSLITEPIPITGPNVSLPTASFPSTVISIETSSVTSTSTTVTGPSSLPSSTAPPSTSASSQPSGLSSTSSSSSTAAPNGAVTQGPAQFKFSFTILSLLVGYALC